MHQNQNNIFNREKNGKHIKYFSNTAEMVILRNRFITGTFNKQKTWI